MDLRFLGEARSNHSTNPSLFFFLSFFLFFRSLSVFSLKESENQPQTLEQQAAAYDEEEHVCITSSQLLVVRSLRSSPCFSPTKHMYISHLPLSLSSSTPANANANPPKRQHIERTIRKARAELTQPNLTNRALVLRSQLAGLLPLHDALDFGLRLAALGGFGFGVGFVCAALLGGLDLLFLAVRDGWFGIGDGWKWGFLGEIGLEEENEEAHTILAVVLGVVFGRLLLCCCWVEWRRELR